MTMPVLNRAKPAVLVFVGLAVLGCAMEAWPGSGERHFEAARRLIADQGQWVDERVPGAIIIGSPSIAFIEDGSARMFFRGPNDHLFVSSRENDAERFGPPADLGANFLTCSPSVVWNGAYQEMVVYYCGRNRNLWFTHWPDVPGGHWWSKAYDTGLPAVSVGTTLGAGAEVYFEGSDHNVHVLRPSGGWRRDFGSRSHRCGPGFTPSTICTYGPRTRASRGTGFHNSRSWNRPRCTPLDAMPSQLYTEHVYQLGGIS